MPRVTISCRWWAWLYFSDREHRAKITGDMHAACGLATLQTLKQSIKLLPVHEAMFCEASPGPVKYAASLAFAGDAITVMEIATAVNHR